MYLNERNLPDAAAFVVGGLWQDYKRALNERKPAPALSSDVSSTAAQQFFLRRGYEQALEDIEKLTREVAPLEVPAIPPSLLDTRD